MSTPTPGERVHVSMVGFTSQAPIKDRIVMLDGEVVGILPEARAHHIATLLVAGLQHAEVTSYDPTSMHLVNLQKERDGHLRVIADLQESLTLSRAAVDRLQDDKERILRERDETIRQLVKARDDAEYRRDDANRLLLEKEAALANMRQNRDSQVTIIAELQQHRDRWITNHQKVQDERDQAIHERDQYKELHSRYQRAADKVFQPCTGDPAHNCILPNFLRPGDDKPEGVIKLAIAYQDMNTTHVKLIAERDQLQRQNDNQARFVQQYMDDARELRAKLDTIEPASKTEILSALSVLQVKIEDCITSVKKA